MKTQVADWTVSNNVLLAVEYLCDFYNNVETKTTEENTATGRHLNYSCGHSKVTRACTKQRDARMDTFHI
jgi:hypothetical protein